MDFRMRVDDEHFEYLRLQKGSLDPYAGDRVDWHRRYEESLRETFDQIAPHLPPTCWGMLDIGSGLGGIDVLIGRHYCEPRLGADVTTVEDADPIFLRRPAQPWPYTHLLDGIDDRPVMKLHRETFNDMRVAKDFQVKNGMPAERFGFFGTRDQFYSRPYDLVVSFGSWCFHYSPDKYLQPLLSGGGLHLESVIIIDVRKGKPDYERTLSRALECVAVIDRQKKYTRAVFRRRQ